MFYKKVGIKLGGVSDWWRHLRKHLGTNESKTTLCMIGGAGELPPTPQSSCISIKPVYSTSSVT